MALGRLFEGYIEMLREEKLTPMRIAILSLLEESPLNIRQITKKLSDEKFISYSSYQSVYRHIEILKKKGFIELKKKKEKSFPVMISLTPKARSFIIKTDNQKEISRNVIKQFSKNETLS